MNEYESVRRWVAELKTKETEKQFLRDMRVFTDWGNITPDYLIEERWKNLRSDNPTDVLHAKDRLMRFWHEAPFKPSSKSHVIAALKSFYRANGMVLSMRTPKAERVRERDYIPTNGDIQKMIELSNKRDSVMLLIQAETGLRVGALVSLRWKHFNSDLESPSLIPRRNPIKVIIPDAITQPGITFICEDGARYLRRWLLGRDLNPETLIFDIDPNTATRMVGRVAIRAGIIPEGKGPREFRSHCFRKRVQTLMENAGVPLNFVDLMLDHVPRGAQASAYARPSEEMLRQAYAKAASSLRVF